MVSTIGISVGNFLKLGDDVVDSISALSIGNLGRLSWANIVSQVSVVVPNSGVLLEVFLPSSEQLLLIEDQVSDLNIVVDDLGETSAGGEELSVSQITRLVLWAVLSLLSLPVIHSSSVFTRSHGTLVESKSEDSLGVLVASSESSARILWSILVSPSEVQLSSSLLGLPSPGRSPLRVSKVLLGSATILEAVSNLVSVQVEVSSDDSCLIS